MRLRGNNMGTLPMEGLTKTDIIDAWCNDIRSIVDQEPSTGMLAETYEDGMVTAEYPHYSLIEVLVRAGRLPNDAHRLALILGFIARRVEKENENV
jgi:hypothetical protein